MEVVEALGALSVAHDASVEGRDVVGVLDDCPLWARPERLLSWPWQVYMCLHSAGVHGSYIERVRFTSLGRSVATVARLILAAGPGVDKNTSLLAEVDLPATMLPGATIDFPVQMALPPASYLWVEFVTQTASGWQIDVHSNMF